jgi:hypothetical protein
MPQTEWEEQIQVSLAVLRLNLCPIYCAADWSPDNAAVSQASHLADNSSTWVFYME